MINFTLRINEKVAEELKKIADKNKRSMNSEINYIIEKKRNREKNKNKYLSCKRHKVTFICY